MDLTNPNPNSFQNISENQGPHNRFDGKVFSAIQKPDKIIQQLPSKWCGCINEGKCTTFGITIRDMW
jgi:hypothetical protein